MRPPALSARTMGALAVVGLVIAFSLSSTLVKRAETPGVLVAFWRLAVVSVVWNLYLRSTGRRVTLRHVRQAFVPGVFFGVNLATFFSGATHNSVANAALIGSLSPFLIVPLGAILFKEYINPKALVFALVAFGGAVIVLFSAPPERGRLAARQRVRGTRDAAVDRLRRVDPALPPGHGRGHLHVDGQPDRGRVGSPVGARQRRRLRNERTGWVFTLLLTFLTGVAAHGLLVFAQKTIQIGTIGIAQVVQPAMAVVWSFLLLGETLRERQMLGIAISMSGLLAFLVVHERGARTRRAAEAAAALQVGEAPLVVEAVPEEPRGAMPRRSGLP